MKRFSIIIPFHNAAETIADTAESLLAQSFEDWEAIFVNDWSDDASERIVAGYAARDVRIRLLQNLGKGPSEARNHAARMAQGKILAFCDADDLWTSDKLSALDPAFADADVHAVFGRIGFFSRTPSDSRTQSSVPAGALTIPALLAENPVCTMSNLSIRRGLYLRCGGLDPAAVHNEDLEFLIRLVGEGARVVGLNHLQVWYRTNPTGLSSDLAAMQAGRRRALTTAADFGFHPTPGAEAVYMRYLARRALRLNVGRGEAWAFTLSGLRQSAGGFLFPMRRGLATAAASAVALGLPSSLRRALFSR